MPRDVLELKALAELKWKPGETDADFEARIGQPYEAFKERALAVQEALKSSLAVKSAAAATPPARSKDAAKAAPKAAPKASASAPATSAAN